MNRSASRYYILFLLIFSWGSGYSQRQNEIDSLKKLVSISKEDTTKVRLLLQLGPKSFYATFDYNNTISYAEEALQLSIKLKFKKGEALSHNLLGRIYSNRLDFPKAIEEHLLALKIMEDMNDTSGVGDCYFYIGDVFKALNGYDRSFTYLNMALVKFQNVGDTNKIGRCLEKMGHVSMDKTSYLPDNEAVDLINNRALKYYHRALELYRKANNPEKLATSYVNIANAYLGLGSFVKDNREEILDNSIFYSNLSLTISRKIKGSELTALNLLNIGEAYEKKNDDAKAIEYYLDSFKEADLINDLNWMMIGLQRLGRIYLKKKEYNKSTIYLERSIKMSTNIESPLTTLESYELLSNVYSASKNFEKAFFIQKKIASLKDSVQIEKTKIATTLIQVEFESERKDKEIALLNKNQELQTAKFKQEKTTRYYLIASVFLVFLLLILTYNRYRVKLKTNKIIEEKNRQLEKLSIVARETANGVFITDANGNLEWFNEGFSKLFGWKSIEEFRKERGKNIFDVSGNDNIDDLIKESIDQKKSITYENANPTKNGNEVWIQTTLTPIFNQQGQLTKLVFIETDITKLKNSEEQYLAVNKELEAFSYSISHDLRSPLIAINGYSKILQEDYSANLDAEGMHVLNAILKSSRKMGDLIDDLLEFSRLGRTEITTSEINMDALVKSSIEEVMIGNSNKIEFTLNELLPSKGSQALIKQVWINLISNAIKFSKHEPKPSIEIGSYYKDNLVVYYVKDNGAGFDMRYYDKLFGVFQRLHSQHEFEGTGIGLAIVKKIVNRHNGTVWAESKLNEGACFYFSLPIINS
jgi:PAS domain S-box-containing protein